MEQLFAVGDKVEVVAYGMGIGGGNIGRRTIITAINGQYLGSNDAVQTKDFKNPMYGDWIDKSSFKLVKSIRKLFKAGDKVAVVECEGIKMWTSWGRALGKIYILKSHQASVLNKGMSTPLGKNEFLINFPPEALERFK